MGLQQTGVRCVVALFALVAAESGLRGAPLEPKWQHFSSARGDLPVPGESNMQTAAVVGDFDGDGIHDFVLGCRGKAPAMSWYRRKATGWDRFVIEKDQLPIEAGGAVCDIDGDGDLDVVFGGDSSSRELWWWENPSPRFNPEAPWTRRTIKKEGRTQHHDQAFGDLLGKGRSQLAFWNQGAQSIFLAQIPPDPRQAAIWPSEAIYAGTGGAGAQRGPAYPEGMSVFDVDADGEPDLLAGNMWFKHTGEGEFKPTLIGEPGGLILAGYFKSGKYPQVAISPGDGVGRLRWYECMGDPSDSASWKGHDLLHRDIIHGHSLQLADLNRDGFLDIFVAEMAKWSERQPNPDHPDATAWLFLGDGKGRFSRVELVKGMGWHEARVQDLDGDGDLDILQKPYNWEAPRVDVWLNDGTRPGGRGVGTSASFKGPVGLQLWSLRDILGENVPLGLQYARNFGFVEVELAGTYGLAPREFRKRLDRCGLKAVAGHWPFEQWEKEPEAVASEAAELGVTYAGCAWLADQGRFDEALCRRAAAVFNRAGEVLARRKMKFFYHNHGYEFVPHGDGTLFDLLMKETNPELVCHEMDVFWTVHAGQDPVELLKRYAGRWELFHIKDMKKGVQTGKLTGSEDLTNDVALGTGQIDLAGALRAAQEQGCRHYFIEDESPSVVEQVPQSVRYLESLAW